MLPFHLPYFRPFKERFWESYIYNGKGGEWGGGALFFCAARQPLPLDVEPTSPAPNLPPPNSMLPEFLEVVSKRVPSFATGGTPSLEEVSCL